MTEVTRETMRFRRAFIIGLVAVVTVLFLFTIRAYLEPLLLAVVFGALVRPLYAWFLPRLGGRAVAASLLTIILTVLVVVIPMLGFLSILVAQAQEVVALLTPWVRDQIAIAAAEGGRLPEWVPFVEQLEPYRATISAKAAEIASRTGQAMVSGLSTATSGTMSFLLRLFVMLYAMFFFLMSGPEILRRGLDYLPLSEADKDNLVETGRSVSRATIKGTLLIGIAQGALGGLSFAVAGIPGTIFWATMMAIMSVIPGIGTYVIWVPIVGYLFLTGDAGTAVGLTLWNGIVVGTVDNVLRPILVGKDAKMPDLLVMLSTLGGLAIFGASGLIFGPVIAGLFLTVWSIYARAFDDVLERPAPSLSPPPSP